MSEIKPSRPCVFSEDMGTGHIESLTEQSAQAGPTLNLACSAFFAPYFQMLGHWYYDGTREQFLFDRTCAEILNCPDHHQWYPISTVVNALSEQDAARFWLNVKQRTFGDVVFERIELQVGPLQGRHFVIQGSILKRDDSGAALYATGYISHESSPYSEFIPRELSGDGLYLWYPPTDEIICSSSFHASLGYTETDFPRTMEEYVHTIVHPDDNDVFIIQKKIAQSPQYGNYFESCQRLKHKDGHYLWMIGRGLVIERDERGQALKIIGSRTNINLMQSNFDNIKLMMFTDSLTGLHNRNYFQQQAMRYIDPKVQPLSVIFIDVSGLKLTNDILGHSYGDYLLIKTCELISQAVSENANECDLIAHLKARRPHITMDQTLISDLKHPTPLDTPPTAQGTSTPLGMPTAQGTPTPQGTSAPLGMPTAQGTPTAPGTSTPLGMPTAQGTSAPLNPPAPSEGTLAAGKAEILRLAGDEFLVLLPSCPFPEVQAIATRIDELRAHNNNYHREHSAIEVRPVPVFFGIGVATMGEAQFEQDAVSGARLPTSDDLRQVIDRADARMQADKESKRDDNYRELKAYFEAKKGRAVSMRDERRMQILTEDERNELRAHSVSHIIF